MVGPENEAKTWIQNMRVCLGTRLNFARSHSQNVENLVPKLFVLQHE